jgi:hypothetical protein
MNKKQTIEASAKLSEAYQHLDHAWAVIRMMATATEAKESPPAWVVRDTCGAIEELIADSLLLIGEVGSEISKDIK